ncbi:formaldehyde dehydrogenase AdhA [Phytophthora nicotianae]|uniref:Formaldehyde dehydrogenase AdhA n=1 Tax=Phytophthora nicotianae TaxID=4792 RepID=A0A0W8CWV9_PHYNI|nr:formaldehyde dehydrogenase AdhA [Phytophthora nicotianae]
MSTVPRTVNAYPSCRARLCHANTNLARSVKKTWKSRYLRVGHSPPRQRLETNDVSMCVWPRDHRPCKECADSENTFCNRSVITYDAQYEDGSMANFAFKIPDNIPSASAAPLLLCAGVTVFTPLKRNVKPGDLCIIRALGATPVAFSRSANKEKEIRDLGAKEFYNLSDPEDQKKAANSVNVLLLTADATNLPYNTYLTLVKKRGTFIMVGVLNEEVKFKPMFVVAKGIQWVGSLIGRIQDI